MASLLLVCTANICRSPMAEALFKARLGEHFQTIQSAGVHADPRGGPVDARAAAALARHDLSLDRKWRSRRVSADDLARFDLVLAMEADHVATLREQAASPEQREKIRLLLDFVPELAGQEVPDPYFGPANGFDAVIALLERGAQGLLAEAKAGRLQLA
jgi:protein-tyrosine phosphatase